MRPVLDGLDDLLRDARLAVRMLRRSPGFTASALLILALGIGGTAVVFSLLRTVILQPLPYREPDRVVTVWETNRNGTRNVISYANFVAWRERTRTLDHLGMVGPAGLAIAVDGRAYDVSGQTVSAESFLALGAQPAIGRLYTPEEDFAAGAGVIVLSHEFWQARLGGRRDVLDVTLGTADGPYRVIGVMPPDFTIAGDKASFYIPYGLTIAQLRASDGRESSYAIARLRDGVSFAQAAADMRGVQADLEKEFPRRNALRTVLMFPVHEQMVADLRPALFALAAAVALVLLVACVNVASLTLARSVVRVREVGMRAALGAGRARLVRQLVTESLVLAVAGGLSGLAVAMLLHRGLLALVGDRIPVPRIDQLTLDWPVVAFTMTVAMVTGVVFGIVPAFVSTGHAFEALREGGRHGGGPRLRRALGTLVIAEIALSLVLLAAAGLLMRSLVNLQRVDLGFRTRGVLTAVVPLPRVSYDVPKAVITFNEAMTRIAALPGVQSAAGSTCLPVPFACSGTSFWAVDRPRPPDGQLPSGQIRPVTPGFFRTLAIPLRDGRDFSDADRADSLPVVVVSAEVVRQQFADRNPIGRRLRVNIQHANGRSDMEWTIVGVVGDVRSTLDGPVRQTIFMPFAQRPARVMTFFIRAADPAPLAAGVGGIMRAIEPEAPVDVRTLDDVVGATIARPRGISVLLAAFALIGVTLAAVGVYGMLAYTVRERTHEIGVRIALGASTASVFGLVLGQALRLVGAGVAAGLAAAAALTRLLAGLLFGVTPLDPWTLAVTTLLLAAIATVAALLPARRGTLITPAEALRAR
jgi:putative ABC transport system permease protein